MALEIPQLNSCCCGCTLKTGTKIIGWLELIGSIALVVLFGIGIAALTTIEDDPDRIPDSPSKKQIIELIPIMKLLLYMLVSIALFSSGLAFILLLGVHQNKANLVSIWVVAALTITVLSALVNTAQFTYSHDSSQFLSSVIGFLIQMYFILVVYSYYREIRNVSNNWA